MTADDMVVMDLNGNKVEGRLNPSSIRRLILNFTEALTISVALCIHIQAGHALVGTGGRDIPAYGTTHADFANGAVPCARGLTGS